MSLSEGQVKLFDRVPRRVNLDGRSVLTEKGALQFLLGRSVTSEVMEGNPPAVVRGAVQSLTRSLFFGSSIGEAVDCLVRDCPDLTTDLAGRLVGEAEDLYESLPPDGSQDFTLIQNDLVTTTRMN